MACTRKRAIASSTASGLNQRSSRHARGRPVLVDIGEVAPLEVRGGVLAEALDALVSEPRRVHAPDATIAAMRWLVLGLGWLAMATVAHAVGDPPLRVPNDGAVSAQARFNEGRALAERRDWPAAERRYRDAIELDPALPEPWNGLGYALRQQRRWGESVKGYLAAPGAPAD